VKNSTFEKYGKPNFDLKKLTVEIAPNICYDDSEGITVNSASGVLSVSQFD